MSEKLLQIACTLIFDQDGKLLLLRRHSSKHGGGMWGAPGGKRDPGETFLATVLRETQEETGLVFSHMDYLGEYEAHLPTDDVHMAIFTATLVGDATVTTRESEHQEYAWFDLDNFLETPDLLWGLPTILRDFAFVPPFAADPTLPPGVTMQLINQIEK